MWQLIREKWLKYLILSRDFDVCSSISLGLYASEKCLEVLLSRGLKEERKFIYSNGPRKVLVRKHP